MLQNKITFTNTFLFSDVMRNRGPLKNTIDKDIITYNIVIILKSDLYYEI